MTLTLVQRIKALRPTLTDEDFFKNVRVESSSANDTQTLVEWNHPSLSRPTDSELGAVTQSDYDKISHRDYIKHRQANYPDIGDQLDNLYKDMLAGRLDHTGEWAKSIKAVKDANPKS